jgi:hypothetical protein
MSRSLSRAAIVCLLTAFAVPLVLLSLPEPQVSSGEVFAPCHQERPVSGIPGMPNHDCCIVGHNHVLPSSAPATPVLLFAMETPLTAVLLSFSMQPRPAPPLTSFDPPPNELPLRI